MNKPALWKWALTGLGLDALALAALSRLAVVPFAAAWSDWPALQAWALTLVLMVVAWVMHVALLPIIFGKGPAPGTGTLLITNGFAFLLCAGLLAPALGIAGGGILFAVLSPLILPLLLLESAAWPMEYLLQLGFWVGIAIGAAVAGLILQAMRPDSSSSRKPGPWQTRSDMVGGVLAMVGSCGGLAIIGRLGTGAIPPAGLSEFFSWPVLQTALAYPALFASVGTFAFLPHLLLLGLDLRRAAQPTSPNTSPAAPATPPG